MKDQVVSAQAQSKQSMMRWLIAGASVDRDSPIHARTNLLNTAWNTTQKLITEQADRHQSNFAGYRYRLRRAANPRANFERSSVNSFTAIRSTSNSNPQTSISQESFELYMADNKKGFEGSNNSPLCPSGVTLRRLDLATLPKAIRADDENRRGRSRRRG
jgi:hypothetical protein